MFLLEDIFPRGVMLEFGNDKAGLGSSFVMVNLAPNTVPQKCVIVMAGTDKNTGQRHYIVRERQTYIDLSIGKSLVEEHGELAQGTIMLSFLMPIEPHHDRYYTDEVKTAAWLDRRYGELSLICDKVVRYE